MNAIISLCHFCDQHGPSVLFSTQSYSSIGQNEDAGQVDQKWKYGFCKNMQKFSLPKACASCQSIPKNEIAFISNDDDSKVSYVSSQLPLHWKTFQDVKLACVRSLTCESWNQKQIGFYFGDKIRGHVIAYPFYLHDFTARAKRRFFSILVFMRDEMYLLNSWDFFMTSIGKIISELQKQASKVYWVEREGTVSLDQLCEDAIYQLKEPRSLSLIIDNEKIWSHLHYQFTWMLLAGDKRLVEIIYRCSSIDTVSVTEKEYNCLMELVNSMEEQTLKKILHIIYTANSVVIDSTSSLIIDEVINAFHLLMPHVLRQFMVHGSKKYADLESKKKYFTDHIMYMKCTALVDIMKPTKPSALNYIIKLKVVGDEPEKDQPQIVDEIVKIVYKRDFSTFAVNITMVLDDWKQKSRLWSIARMVKPSVNKFMKEIPNYSYFLDYVMAEGFPILANEVVSNKFAGREERLKAIGAKELDLILLSKWAYLYEFSRNTNIPHYCD